MFFDYWFLPTKNLADGHAVDHKLLNEFRKASHSIYEDYPLYDVKVKFTLADALSFMLGFDNTEFVFQQKWSRTVKAEEVMAIKSVGLNFVSQLQ